MGELARKVTEAYKSLEPREVDVPEWGVTLFVFPITLKQYSEINEATGIVDKMLAAIRIRGKTSDGKPVLDTVDVDALRTHGANEYGLKVVSRVALEIMGDVSGFAVTDEAVDDAEKK